MSLLRQQIYASLNSIKHIIFPRANEDAGKYWFQSFLSVIIYLPVHGGGVHVTTTHMGLPLPMFMIKGCPCFHHTGTLLSLSPVQTHNPYM